MMNIDDDTVLKAEDEVIEWVDSYVYTSIELGWGTKLRSIIKSSMNIEQ